MPKEHITIRVSAETVVRLERLRREWGGVRSLSVGETIEEAVARAARAEDRSEKSRKKSAVPS